MKKMTTTALLLAGMLISTPTAWGREAIQQETVGKILADKAMNRVVERLFSDDEKKAIKGFFDEEKKSKKHHKGDKKKHKGLPPGLAKKDHLPPGLQKQLERNGHLPPGLEKRALPSDISYKLPSCKKKKYECAIVGDDVVLLEKGTDLILDVIEKALSQ